MVDSPKEAFVFTLAIHYPPSTQQQNRYIEPVVDRDVPKEHHGQEEKCSTSRGEGSS